MPAPAPQQLDIFLHSHDVMLRNDVLSALERRDAADARLQDKPGCKDLVRSFKRMLARLDFRCHLLGVAAKGKRPNACTDEQAHGLRARSAL